MSLVSPMTNEITLYAAECAHVTHLYMKVAGGHLGTDLGGGKGRYHAVGLDKQKVVLLWTLADERGRGKKHARYKAG